MPEEFPAVIVPSFEKTGASLAIFSSVASRNKCSSREKMVAPFLPSIVTGAISASKRPLDCAAAARCCDTRRTDPARRARSCTARQESRPSRPSASLPSGRRIRRDTCHRQAPDCRDDIPSARRQDNKEAATSIRFHPRARNRGCRLRISWNARAMDLMPDAHALFTV
jgi:hypothetical protein